MTTRDRLKELFSRVYDVLVEVCGAQDTERARLAFVIAMTESEPNEYRFGGKLGSGGKFFMPNFIVSYYTPESETPERNELRMRANAALRPLRDEYEAMEG